jgi:hypothetical protein
MRGRADQAGPFFESLTSFFYRAHRSWYEVLHDRWSRSVHRAMPEIEAVDPVFHAQLLVLIDGPSAAARVAAAEQIFAMLCPNSNRGAW